jgi:hypothetical protein
MLRLKSVAFKTRPCKSCREPQTFSFDRFGGRLYSINSGHPPTGRCRVPTSFSSTAPLLPFLRQYSPSTAQFRMLSNTAQGQKRSLKPTIGETFNTPRKRQHIESNKEQLIPLSQFESLVFHYPVLDSIASQLPNNDIYNICRCSKFLQKSFQSRLYKEVHILKSAHLLQILKIIDVVKKYCKKLVIAVTDESKDFSRVYHIALEPSYLDVLETLPQNLHIFEATSRSRPQPIRVNPIIAVRNFECHTE